MVSRGDIRTHLNGLDQKQAFDKELLHIMQGTDDMSSYCVRLKELRESAGMRHEDVAEVIANEEQCWPLSECLKKVGHEEYGSPGVDRIPRRKMVRLTEIIDCTYAEATELVARRMAEEYGLGDEWWKFSHAAEFVVHQYSDEYGEEDDE